MMIYPLRMVFSIATLNNQRVTPQKICRKVKSSPKIVACYCICLRSQQWRYNMEVTKINFALAIHSQIQVASPSAIFVGARAT